MKLLRSNLDEVHMGRCRWAVVAVAGLLLAAGSAWAAEDELPGVGAEAPAFALPVYNPDASKVSRAGTMLLVGDDTEDPNTKVILVSFMASHCKPCKKELPFLQQLFAKYAPAGLRVIGVAIDSEPEGQKKMGEILEQFKVTFPVAKDQYNFTARRFLGDKVPLPSVFIMDKAGVVRFVSRGYNEEIGKKLLASLTEQLGTPVEAEMPKEDEAGEKAPTAGDAASDGAKDGAKATKTGKGKKGKKAKSKAATKEVGT